MFTDCDITNLHCRERLYKRRNGQRDNRPRVLRFAEESVLQKKLHCRRHWRHWQISPLLQSLADWHGSMNSLRNFVKVNNRLYIVNRECAVGWWWRITDICPSHTNGSGVLLLSRFTFWHRKCKILALFDQFRLFCHIYALFNVFLTGLTIAAVY